MNNDADNTPNIDVVTLETVLHSLLGADAKLAGPWRGDSLHGGLGGQGLYRFQGHAHVREIDTPWSVVLKVCPAEDGVDEDQSAWNAPRREALAYGSGFLASLPGPLVAPRCLGLTERSDGADWLWLENIEDTCPGPWDRDRLALVARHLGRFNGAYPVAGPLPDYAWLSRDWLRRYIAFHGPATGRLAIAADAPPLLRQSFPPSAVASLRRLWTEREVFLSMLDRLPQTLCHHDAFRRNLFVRQAADGTEQTVAIDWAFAGIGAVGADLAPLVVGSLVFFEISGAAPRDLAETALTEYGVGLRDAGCDVDERLVRLGFLATAALLYTVGTAGIVVDNLGDPARYPAIEQALGRPVQDVVASRAELMSFQFELAEEARRLVASSASRRLPPPY